MKTLAELVQEHGAGCVVYADAGNGCGFGEAGRAIDYDEREFGETYGAQVMHRLEAVHVADDGTECLYGSDWVTVGEGDNPYRYRLLF